MIPLLCPQKCWKDLVDGFITFSESLQSWKKNFAPSFFYIRPEFEGNKDITFIGMKKTVGTHLSQ